MQKYPFEATFGEILQYPDQYVEAVVESLESEFLVMPKGVGFVEYSVFERGYEALKLATRGFSELEPTAVFQAILAEPICIVVLRTMLGFTPPEWAYVTTVKTGVNIDQGSIRTLDRKVRISPAILLKPTGMTSRRLEALVETACFMLRERAPSVKDTQLHRLDKADTRSGLDSLKAAAQIGVPYAMLLYERFLGRPFASHRDSVSELKGDRLETAIEDVLTKHGISYRKTKRAERIEGFDQAPDFIVPSEFNAKVIVEAKMTEDDGTARDKVTRIQHLGDLSLAGRPAGNPKYEVIACFGGRGFGVRREDMKKMILATRGKVVTPKTLDRLIENTQLKEFATK